MEESIYKIWKDFNKNCEKLRSLVRTRNTVGEIAEFLAKRYYDGEYLPISDQKADIIANNLLYEVKSRKIDKLKSTQLNVIRSWDFDYLVVILFDNSGEILKVIEVKVDVAKSYAKSNKHQNGSVITTSKEFLNDKRNKDLTKDFKKLFQSI